MSIKATVKCIVYNLCSLLVKSHRATLLFKTRGFKTLLGEIKTDFDWHNLDDKETVLLPLLH